MDGNAHTSHAINRFAVQIVETGLSLEVKHATMAMRMLVMGAAQHARSSADSTALAVTQARVRQSAETALSLATRHVTTATLMVGMAAVRTAQM
jgi:hypothetical protein